MSAFFRLISSLRRTEPKQRIASGSLDDFDLGDRIGQPVKRRKSKLKRRLVLALGLSGLGAATYHDPSMWPKAWSVAAPVASSLIDTAMTAATSAMPPAKPAEKPLQKASIEEPKTTEPSRPAETPASQASPASPQPQTVETREATRATAAESSTSPVEDTRTPAEAAKDAAITAMRAPITDPHQKRAEAVGLHPDLSPALLKRLTDTDFKTAAAAIRKALTEVDDNSVLVWPEKPKPETAMFHVSFVPGAATTDCRRYIVAIAKDGWQTTALPVEKCGVKRIAVRKS